MYTAEFTEEEVSMALKRIEEMDHETMCRLWRFGEGDKPILMRNDLPTGEAFKNRLFNHFGGFSPQISKLIGFKR